MRGVTQGGEDHDTGQHTGQEVNHGDDVCINMDSGVKLVIASEHDDATPGDTEGEEDLEEDNYDNDDNDNTNLTRCSSPNCKALNLFPVRNKQVI